jgi:chemotaxis signal transduction protein
VTADGTEDVRRELLRRAAGLERELYDVRDRLRDLGSDVLPGTFVEAEVPGVRFLVPVAAVREVVWLVELAPAGAAPPWVAGSFSYRGETLAAIDLARRLGADREPPLDAKMLVLSTTRPVAAIVDRVHGLVADPRLHRPAPDDRPVTGPFSGVCEHGARLWPLLDPEALADGAIAG